MTLEAINVGYARSGIAVSLPPTTDTRSMILTLEIFAKNYGLAQKRHI